MLVEVWREMISSAMSSMKGLNTYHCEQDKISHKKHTLTCQMVPKEEEPAYEAKCECHGRTQTTHLECSLMLQVTGPCTVPGSLPYPGRCLVSSGIPHTPHLPGTGGQRKAVRQD